METAGDIRHKTARGRRQKHWLWFCLVAYGIVVWPIATLQRTPDGKPDWSSQGLLKKVLAGIGFFMMFLVLPMGLFYVGPRIMSEAEHTNLQMEETQVSQLRSRDEQLERLVQIQQIVVE